MIAAQTPGLASKRVLTGVALSILAHAAIVFLSRPTVPPYVAPAPTPIVLHLQPLPAPAPVVEATLPPPEPATRSRAAAAPRPPRRVIAVAPKPTVAAAPEVVVEAQPVETPPPTPKKFDLDAARSTARIVGLQDAPNADDAPLARLKKQELANQIRYESKAAQAISAAKRGDCKDGLPGGLLAPLIMLTQKAGTGCKW
ncbi:MAG: hypothetical protein M3Y65_21400 [Pseudomonadota bacterium]|nr:hypothetical protein [Pseudomonadota bacterium]